MNDTVLLNDVLFSTLAMLVIPFLVAAVIALAERIGFVWAKVNQPTIAAIIGALLGALYRVEAVYSSMHGKLPDAPLATFVLMGVGVGLAAAGVKSLAKDVKSGAIKSTSIEDVQAMRTSSKEIGS